MIIDQGAAGALIIAVTTATAAMLYRRLPAHASPPRRARLGPRVAFSRDGAETLPAPPHRLLDRVRNLLRRAASRDDRRDGGLGSALPRTLTQFAADDGDFTSDTPHGADHRWAMCGP